MVLASNAMLFLSYNFFGLLVWIFVILFNGKYTTVEFYLMRSDIGIFSLQPLWYCGIFANSCLVHLQIMLGSLWILRVKWNDFAKVGWIAFLISVYEKSSLNIDSKCWLLCVSYHSFYISAFVDSAITGRIGKVCADLLLRIASVAKAIVYTWTFEVI